MYAEVVLKLTGPLDQLRLVWQTGESLLESVRFEEDDEGTRYNVLLALQEMVTNVLRHAYNLDYSLPVEITFRLTDDAFATEIGDQGPAFDPLSHDTTAVELGDAMPVEAGGYGIHIARMVMDEVEYERRGGWNRLRMKKHIRIASPLR